MTEEKQGLVQMSIAFDESLSDRLNAYCEGTDGIKRTKSSVISTAIKQFLDREEKKK